MSSEFTFVVDKTCPICKQSTRVVKLRAKLPVVSVDEDFCAHYKSGFNPYFYHIWVCEHCGFAGDEKNFLSVMPKKHKDKITKVLEEKKIKFIFMEERKMPEAVASYRLARLFAELRDMSLHQQAGIYLRIAWLYRFSEEKEKELEYLRKSVDLYVRSRSIERYPQGSMTEYDLIYLIAAIYYRMDDRENCKKYVSILMSMTQLHKLAPQVYVHNKKLWEKIRENDKANEKSSSAAKKAAGTAKKTSSSSKSFWR